MNRCNKNNKSPRVKTGTNQLLNELLALRERLDVLICMCDAELNQRQSNSALPPSPKTLYGMYRCRVTSHS